MEVVTKTMTTTVVITAVVVVHGKFEPVLCNVCSRRNESESGGGDSGSGGRRTRTNERLSLGPGQSVHNAVLMTNAVSMTNHILWYSPVSTRIFPTRFSPKVVYKGYQQHNTKSHCAFFPFPFPFRFCFCFLTYLRTLGTPNLIAGYNTNKIPPIIHAHRTYNGSGSVN